MRGLGGVTSGSWSVVVSPNWQVKFPASFVRSLGRLRGLPVWGMEWLGHGCQLQG